MKKIFAIFVSVLVAGMLFLNGCQALHDFGDINKSPNSPSTAFTSYLFTNACRYIPQFVLGNATNGYDPWQQEWAGYLSESKNNQYGPLSTTSSFGSTSFYLYALKNLQMVVDMNEDPEQKDLTNVSAFGTAANQIAAAKTLMAFYYMTISDINGPVIISEALKGSSEDIWTPKYDTQEEAYTILNNSLAEAYRQFDESGSLDAAADVLFGGNIAKWKKFNASLRMLMAIKLSDVDPNTGKTRFAAAYNDGGMTDVADGFYYSYDDLNWNMLYYWCNPSYSGAGFNAVPNYFIVEQMKEFKDNRMFKYFDIEGYRGSRDESIFPRDQYTSFYGVPFGLENNTQVTKWIDCCCSVTSSMLAMDATIPVIPTARVLLTEAEAAYRGRISADAKSLYEAGIKASFEQWGATGADAYVKSPAIAYNASKGLEQIALQRWIAGYLADGVEAWSDWRRLDIPHMPVGPGANNVGNTHYPYRLAFSSSYDPVYNEVNYAAAIATLKPSGQDNIHNRVWWDVADNWEGVLTKEQCTPSVEIPAKWEVAYVGVYEVLGGGAANESPVGADVFGHSNFTTTLYEDVNHPGTFKLAPFGDTELMLNWDTATSTFFVPNQIVGSHDGVAVNMADRDTDQDSDGPYRGAWDEDGNLYIYVIYRLGGARGTPENQGILNYGYDVFKPVAN